MGLFDGSNAFSRSTSYQIRAFSPKPFSQLKKEKDTGFTICEDSSRTLVREVSAALDESHLYLANTKKGRCSVTYELPLYGALLDKDGLAVTTSKGNNGSLFKAGRYKGSNGDIYIAPIVASYSESGTPMYETILPKPAPTVLNLFKELYGGRFPSASFGKDAFGNPNMLSEAELACINQWGSVFIPEKDNRLKNSLGPYGVVLTVSFAKGSGLPVLSPLAFCDGNDVPTSPAPAKLKQDFENAANMVRGMELIGASGRENSNQWQNEKNETSIELV